MFIYLYIYIYNIYTSNIGISKHEKHLRLLCSGTKLLLPLSLKVLRHKEREAQSFYSGFVIFPTSRATPVQGLRKQVKANRLLPRQDSTPLIFFRNPPRASGAWRHPHSVTPFPISGHCDISEWHIRSTHARVNTCVNVAPK